ncbi:hypothetical protein C0Q70_02385 [Pomacea canaliculata]|uniref:SAM domain-containing protein n=1 Tax=Pomacea canaliculata TaxID=400727 RepID=A0A2T7PPR9_POMCA|nr:hypothetical protein C0Q70_02385 [Pomacea canaliculata]
MRPKLPHDIEVQTYATPARLSSIQEDPPSPTPTRDHQADIFPSYDEQSADDTDSEVSPEYVPIPVEEWLPPELQGPYVELFKRNGFDSTLFIAGMTETELKRIGVTSRGHLHYLQAKIGQIPAFEIEYKVPVSVNEWLAEIGLSMYGENFRRNQIRVPKEMEILKSLSRKDIERELGIAKDGHIKRLMYAITKLRDPTERQQKAMRMRQVLDDVSIHYLEETNVEEHSFWEKLLEGASSTEKLAELRNNWLVILGVSNTIWLILISTVASKSELTVLGANPLGVSFLFVFGLLFIIQFLTMLVHRLTTVSHYLARAPYRCGRPMKTTWSFKGGSGQKVLEDSADILALQQTAIGRRKSDARLRGRKRKSRQPSPALGVVDERADEQANESTPLI